MARPTKKGLDYFPLDVVLDIKFELIEAEFGLNGFGVVVKLYQEIYKQGYYLEWTSEVALLFSKKVGLGGNVVSEIVKAAVKRDIFDRVLFEKYGILTSHGIQKRYIEGIKRRDKTEMEQSYLLLDCTQIPSNVHLNQINVNNNSVNVSINTQSKVKESKVNKSKIYTAQNEPADLDICPFFEELWRLYPNQKGRNKITESALKEINDIGKDKMLQAVKAYRLEVSEKDLQYIKHGNTFFNGDYKDYLNKPTAAADLIIDSFNKVPVFIGT